MMNNDLVRIIVHVYNVEKYIEKCLNSRFGQTYRELDIILVDDGSTDKSGELCDRLAKMDKRVRVIHKKNGGLSDARNRGIDAAKGRYITFIDSDDYVSGNYIWHLYKLLIESQADIAITRAIKIYEKEEAGKEDSFEEADTCCFSPEEALKDMLYRKNIPVYAGAKLFKMEIFKNIRFPKGELFEDLSTVYLLFHQAGKIVFNPVRDYYYLQRNNSIVNSEFNHRKMIQVSSTERIIAFAQKYYPGSVNAAKSKCFITTLNLYKSIPGGRKFRQDRITAKKVLKKYNRDVFKDKENKKLTRMIAGLSLISIEGVCLIGRLYQWLFRKGIIRLSKPV